MAKQVVKKTLIVKAPSKKSNAMVKAMASGMSEAIMDGTQRMVSKKMASSAKSAMKGAKSGMIKSKKY